MIANVTDLVHWHANRQNQVQSRPAPSYQHATRLMQLEAYTVPHAHARHAHVDTCHTNISFKRCTLPLQPCKDDCQDLPEAAGSWTQTWRQPSPLEQAYRSDHGIEIPEFRIKWNLQVPSTSNSACRNTSKPAMSQLRYQLLVVDTWPPPQPYLSLSNHNRYAPHLQP